MAEANFHSELTTTALKNGAKKSNINLVPISIKKYYDLIFCIRKISAKIKSSGYVIFMFSRFPSTK